MKGDIEGTLAIVVLNWNGAADTIACLHSIIPTLDASVHLLVVDNGSTDCSVERIRAAFPHIEVLELPHNLGFAAGNNAGFRRVQALGAEYLLFLNNDTVVAPYFYRPLLNLLQQHPDVGIAVPKIFYHHQPQRLWYAGGEVNLATALIRHVGLRQFDAPQFNVATSTDYATGCSLAIRVADFEQLGGFDERFTMYAEDVDLSLRVRAQGKRIAYEPSSMVWHKVSASLGNNSLQKLWMKSKAMVRLCIKHRAWSGLLLYFVLLPFRLVRSVGGSLLFKIGKMR
uniref:Glycosyl transferase n=1 Tax=Chlorobium chlorochromatii (strain CaD3) TaxID=340177 RepID=Q3APF8_CHLCH